MAYPAKPNASPDLVLAPGPGFLVSFAWGCALSVPIWLGIAALAWWML